MLRPARAAGTEREPASSHQMNVRGKVQSGGQPSQAPRALEVRGVAVASFPTLPTARAVVLDTGHPQMLVGPALPWAEEPGQQWGRREGPTVSLSHPETQNQPRVVRQGGGHLQPPASSEDTGHVL